MLFSSFIQLSLTSSRYLTGMTEDLRVFSFVRATFKCINGPAPGRLAQLIKKYNSEGAPSRKGTVMYEAQRKPLVRHLSHFAIWIRTKLQFLTHQWHNGLNKNRILNEFWMDAGVKNMYNTYMHTQTNKPSNKHLIYMSVLRQSHTIQKHTYMCMQRCVVSILLFLSSVLNNSVQFV